jgi:TolB-like protein/Tfp pilus assembly protein PilF
MWWLWPHLRRLWTVTGAVLVGLIVTWLYSLLSEQAVPHPSIVATLFHDYWPWFGGAAVALATVSVVAERAYRHREARAPRPLRAKQTLLRTLLDELGAPFRSSRPPIRLHSSQPALVGRDVELARLNELFVQIKAGRRRVVFVSGEPGVGKTMLLHAFLDSLSGEHAVRIGRGNCVEQHGGAEPYMPVLEALTRLCREPGGERLVAILHRLAPAWLAQMPSLVSVEDRLRLQGQAQGAMQNRMLREMVEALEAMAAQAPILLVLEDLHWSDPSTLDLLAALGRRSEPAQLLILATHRGVEALPGDHPLRALKEELGRHRQCAELPLRRLSEEESAALGAAQVAGEQAFAIPRATAWPAVLITGVGALMLGTLVYGIARWRGSAPGPPEGAVAKPRSISSIAVLPLDNFSGDPNQEYFADGLTDELTTDLATISALRVISRGSVMRYKGAQRLPTPEIAKVLNIDAVVEGSVARVGDKVRVTAQLIDARADKHLWAKSYERDSGDVLAMQDEIAQAIAHEVNVELTSDEQAHLANSRAVNPEAHDAYLKGRYFLESYTEERVRKAIEQFEEAIKIDPNFALPYTGLANAYSYGADWYFPAIEVMPKAKAAAQKALQLDDSLAEAHTSLALIKYQFDFDWAGSEREFRRAIELNPNYAFGHEQYGYFLAWQGRFDESVAEFHRASELDPLSAGIATDVAVPLVYQTKYAAAKEQCRNALELDPNNWFAQFVIGWIDIETGKFNEATTEMQKARAMDSPPFVAGWLGYAYAKAGERTMTEATITELNQMSSRRFVSPACTALVYLGLGEKEWALERLEKAYDARSQWLSLLKVDRIFDPLRSEPRFIALLKKVGLDN